MELEQDFVFEPLPAITGGDAQPFTTIASPLGPLAGLAGKWHGTGFNTIWRPHFPKNQPPGQDRFLELNLTTETLEFDVIPGSIPNRGLDQQDIEMFGLHYLQQISDSTQNAGIHIEPGIWATVPATTAPVEQPTVVRMASIPHGTTILAQGNAFTVNGGPIIADNDIIPFGLNGNPPVKSTFAAAEAIFTELNLATDSPFRQPSVANTVPGITQAMVQNPNSVLQQAIVGQEIVNTIVLRVTATATPPPGTGTSNTFFLTENASANVVDAIFWIETVKSPHSHRHFLQLQYTQTVMLDFNGLRWPHVSVATLRKRSHGSIAPHTIAPNIAPADLPPAPEGNLPPAPSIQAPAGQEVELT
jgi:hypothetical protein